MKADRVTAIAMEDALVPGLAGAIGALLITSGQPLTLAWVEVVGPSRIVALSLLVGIGIWLAAALRHDTPWGNAVALISISMSAVIPVEYWALALLGSGFLSVPRRSAMAPTLFALGAIGIHIALLAGRLPELVTLALTVDITLVAAMIELSGRVVSVRDTVLVVEDGMPLRLISQCSSIWPMLSVTGAIGSGLGAMRFSRLRPAYVILVLAVLAVMSLNVLRLAGMSISLEAYTWLHDGTGATLFRLSILVIIIAAFGFAAIRCTPVKAPEIPDAA